MKIMSNIDLGDVGDERAKGEEPVLYPLPSLPFSHQVLRLEAVIPSLWMLRIPGFGDILRIGFGCRAARARHS